MARIKREKFHLSCTKRRTAISRRFSVKRLRRAFRISLLTECISPSPARRTFRFIDQAEAAKLNEGNPFGNYRVFQQTRACSLWQRGNIPADYREPVSSNLPVLIFSGNLDPVTPPQRGEEVAKYLPNSRNVVIPKARHGVDGLSDGGCIDRIIIDFMDKGSANSTTPAALIEWRRRRSLQSENHNDGSPRNGK